MSECGGGERVGASSAPAAGAEPRPQPARSFKLRFAAQREPGRSCVSLVKPLGLPATVTGKFYSIAPAPQGEGEGEGEGSRRIRELFERGPRERLAAPLTESHVYGWWGAARAEARGDRRLDHRIRDSAWLKGRLLVLAADDKLKRK